MFVMSGGAPSARPGTIVLSLNGSSTTVQDLSGNHVVYQSASNPIKMATDVVNLNPRSLFCDNGGFCQLGPVGGSSPAVCPALNFGTSDFTIEFWLKPISDAGVSNVIFTGCSNVGYNYYGATVSFYQGNMGLGITSSTGASVGVGYSSNTSITFGTWTHWAFTRKGTSVSIYKNGVVIAATTVAPTFNVVNDGIPYIGNGFYSRYQYPLNGYLDDLRISRW